VKHHFSDSAGKQSANIPPGEKQNERTQIHKPCKRLSAPLVGENDVGRTLNSERNEADLNKEEKKKERIHVLKTGVTFFLTART